MFRKVLRRTFALVLVVLLVTFAATYLTETWVRPLVRGTWFVQYVDPFEGLIMMAVCLIPVMLAASTASVREVELTYRKSHEQLTESEARYRTLVELSPLLIATHQNGIIQYINAKGASLLGAQDANEVVGRSIVDFVAPHCRSIAQKRLDLIHHEVDHLPPITQSLVGLDGHVSEVEVVASRVSFAGEAAVQLVGRDVSEEKAAGEALNLSRQRYKSLFEHNLDATFSIDCTGQFVEVNPAAARVTGYSVDELVGMQFSDLMASQDLDQTVAAFRKVLSGQPQVVDVQIVHKLGHQVRLHVTAVPIWVNNEVVGAYGISRDVTQQYLADAYLKGQKRVLEMITRNIKLSAVLEEVVTLTEDQLDGAVCSIHIYDKSEAKVYFAAGRRLPSLYRDQIAVVDVDPNCSFLRVAAGGGEGSKVADLVNSTWDMLRAAARAAGLSACWAVPIVGAGESVLGVLIVNYPHSGLPTAAERERIQGLSYLAGLAIERRRSEEHAQHMAYYDPLTDLPNRRLFVRELEEVVRHSSTRMAVMYVDVDRFKVVNDTLGHSAGDMLLRHVAERMRQSVRHGDLVARMSGDEFTILLPNVQSREEVTAVAERLLETFRNPVPFDGSAHTVTLSIGIAMYPDDGTDVQTILQNADAAMYTAKTTGKNQYLYFNATVEGTFRERLRLQSEMERALEHNEFVVYYQPRVHARSGQIVAVEALVRWDHPKLGMIGPKDFISLAEDTGFIQRLGTWVMLEACRQAHWWHERGWPGLRMAVNVSLQQLFRTCMVDDVLQVLEKARLDPKYLELEITESVLMKDEQAVVDTVERLKALGAHIAIDDFGTGYSSLDYLRRFKVGTLKIDYSLVRGIPHQERDAAIASAVISLAHTLGMSVVAEGVETEVQRKFLTEQGCDELQGFLLGAPMPAEKFTDLLTVGQT